MKKKVGILVLLCVGFGIFLIIRYFILESQNIYGKIKIVSSPVASIFINNVATSKVPYEDKLKAGEYLLKLIPEENATDTASWQRKIKVYKNTLTYVNAELGSTDISTAADVLSVTKMDRMGKNDTGELAIETEPNGAIIYVDNDEKGVSSIIVADIPKGDHELSVFMPGFFRRTQKINITSGYRINAFIKLAADKTQPSTFQLDDSKIATPEATQTNTGKQMILIKDTPTGWLRVREDSTINASESGRVNPGQKFELLEEKTGWYKIEFEKNKTGWVSSEYCTKE